MILHSTIAVVVPARNERRLIAKTLRGIPAFVDHIVVVDDASSDATASEVARVADRRVRVTRHPCRRGVGAAIATGCAEARAIGADVVAVMAGDNQMHPDDLESVVLPIVHGRVDFVKGNRLDHPQSATCMPWTRRWGTCALSWCTRKALGIPALRDSQCGFTAISARALGLLDLERLWPGYGYPNDLLGRVLEQGLAWTDVVVRPVYADESSGLHAHHLPLIVGVIVRAGVRLRVRRLASRGNSSQPARSSARC